MSSTSATTDPQRIGTDDVSIKEATRANLYLLLSRAFASPLDMSDAMPDALRTAADELPLPHQGNARETADEWTRALADRETLSLAYARLFLGPFEVLASPYASFYLDPNQRLMGDVSMDVARMYAEASLGPGTGPREAPDHVAFEWEFMYSLTHQYVTTGDAVWIRRRRDFCTSHLERWIPPLRRAILQAHEHPFYDALGTLAAQSCYDTMVRLDLVNSGFPYPP